MSFIGLLWVSLVLGGVAGLLLGLWPRGLSLWLRANRVPVRKHPPASPRDGQRVRRSAERGGFLPSPQIQTRPGPGPGPFA